MPLWLSPFRAESMAAGLVSTLPPLSALSSDQWVTSDPLSGNQSHWDRDGQCFTVEVICLLGLPRPLSLNLVAQLESLVPLKNNHIVEIRVSGFRDHYAFKSPQVMLMDWEPQVLPNYFITAYRTLWDLLLPNSQSYVRLWQKKYIPADSNNYHLFGAQLIPNKVIIILPTLSHFTLITKLWIWKKGKRKRKTSGPKK